MAEFNLLSREQAYRAGYELAVWDEFYCFEHQESLPAYARDAFHKYVSKVILPQLKSKKKKGRIARALREQQQIWDDICAWDVVKDYIQEQGWIKIPKDVSDAQRTVKEWLKEREDPPAVRAARKVMDGWSDAGGLGRVPSDVRNAEEAGQVPQRSASRSRPSSGGKSSA